MPSYQQGIGSLPLCAMIYSNMLLSPDRKARKVQRSVGLLVWLLVILITVTRLAFPASFDKILQKVIHTYPHDEQCYTQGLVLYDNILYESCGLYGKSNIRIVELSTGRVIKSAALSKNIFAEGLTALGKRLYLLSWQNRKLYIYDRFSLALLDSRTITTYTGEGWGLTTDERSLIISDGSDRISFYNIPTDGESGAMIPVRVVKVTMPSQSSGRSSRKRAAPIKHINELEYVNGYIYANIWYEDIILKIHPISGLVVDRYDGARIYPHNSRHPKADCLNGIAYDSSDGTMLLTGKLWPSYYRINFTELDEDSNTLADL